MGHGFVPRTGAPWAVTPGKRLCFPGRPHRFAGWAVGRGRCPRFRMSGQVLPVNLEREGGRPMGTSQRSAELVEPILHEHGQDLYDVELTGATVRVLVENPAGPVDLAALETVSREISAVLDETDPLPDRFFLEVSSPGLERPLRQPQHFAKAIGSLVKIKTTPAVEGDRRVDGTLVAADAD